MLVVEAQPAVTLGHGPCIVVGVVVPLPFKLELVGRIAEFIVLGQCRALVIAVEGQGGRRLAVHAHHRPAVCPCHGNEHRDSADAAVILEKQSVPLAVRCLDDAALCAAAAVGSEAGIQNGLAFIGACDALAAVAKLDSAVAARPCDDEYIVIITDLLDMAALTGKVVQTGLEDGLIDTAGLEAGHIGIELLDLDLAAAAVDEVISAVVIEQHGGIVVHAVDLAACPGAVLNIGGLVNVGLAGAVAAEEDIINAVLVAQAGCPLTVCIVVVIADKILLAAVCVGIVDVIADLPRNQVIRLHDRHARREEHGRADHVIGIADADNVLIRHICPDERIGDGGFSSSSLKRHLRQNGSGADCQQRSQACGGGFQDSLAMRFHTVFPFLNDRSEFQIIAVVQISPVFLYLFL